MPLFHYKGVDKEGKPFEGNLEAKDKFALYHMIKKDGVTITLTEEVKSTSRFSFSGNIPFLSRVKMHDKIIFARNLSKMIDAGLPITRGLSVMEKQAKGGLKTVLSGLIES